MYVVYVLQHSDSREFYIGFTKNLAQRVISHNNQANRATARSVGEWVLVYAEAYRSEHDARVRELKLKHHGNAKHGLFRRIKASIIEDKK